MGKGFRDGVKGMKGREGMKKGKKDEGGQGGKRDVRRRWFGMCRGRGRRGGARGLEAEGSVMFWGMEDVGKRA